MHEPYCSLCKKSGHSKSDHNRGGFLFSGNLATGHKY